MKFSDLIQLTGLVMIGAGIGFEIGRGADIGYVWITLGAIIFAVGTKLKGR